MSNKKRGRVIALSEEPEGLSVRRAVHSCASSVEAGVGLTPRDLRLPSATASEQKQKAVTDRPPVGSTPADSLLQYRSLLNCDEEFGEDEKLLNEFTKLHPMLSCAVPRTPTFRMGLISRTARAGWRRRR